MLVCSTTIRVTEGTLAFGDIDLAVRSRCLASLSIHPAASGRLSLTLMPAKSWRDGVAPELRRIGFSRLGDGERHGRRAWPADADTLLALLRALDDLPAAIDVPASVAQTAVAVGTPVVWPARPAIAAFDAKMEAWRGELDRFVGCFVGTVAAAQDEARRDQLMRARLADWLAAGTNPPDPAS